MYVRPYFFFLCPFLARFWISRPYFGPVVTTNCTLRFAWVGFASDGPVGLTFSEIQILTCLVDLRAGLRLLHSPILPPHRLPSSVAPVLVSSLTIPSRPVLHKQYALLFPGESLTTSPFHVSNISGKETVWALYLRAELLWNSCLRLRYDTSAPDEEKAERAMKVWLETEAIDEALNRHSCGVERACLFVGREYLFK